MLSECEGYLSRAVMAQYTGPVVLHVDLVECLHLTEMSCKGMVHVSTGEHRVGGFQNLRHRCIWSSIVDHQGPGSTGLTDCQGVLWKWDPLNADIRCQN